MEIGCVSRKLIILSSIYMCICPELLLVLHYYSLGWVCVTHSTNQNETKHRSQILTKAVFVILLFILDLQFLLVNFQKICIELYY